MARSSYRNGMAAEIKTYVLEKKRYVLGGHFEDPEMMFNTGQMSIEVIAEDLTRKLRYQLDMFFLEGVQDEVSERVPSIKTELVPESWWDAFKARFFPKLLKNRIKYRTIKTEIVHTTIIRKTHVCPHLPTASHEDHLRFCVGLEPLTDMNPRYENYNEMQINNFERKIR